MTFVYLLVNSEKEVVAIYDDETLAKLMRDALTEKFGVLSIERRSVNQDIKMIGLIK